MEKEFKKMKFEEGNFSLDFIVRKDDNTVWLTQKDLAELFEVDNSSISRHIKNILLVIGQNESVVAENATTGSDGKTYFTKYYNLDIIIAIGYKVRSNRTEIFKQWAERLQNELNNNLVVTEPIIRFEYENISLDVTVSPEENTVWLTQVQICELFDTTQPNISMHIYDIYAENELNL